ncbi:dehydrogenase, putative [Labilithrix luteola]|uniref:Dehydrogenase, putative n=1 Tax=Labilithrix luteola TaxID=1391654 RepID=A0A0K1PWI4_9BACT|nr:NAD(P)-binding domain-containing protein [Labilithrix luteola]AKU97888.1 dehydrogenase, putative [Labilithrix luteola]
MARISILGAGRMGAALVTAFAKGGHAVTVWNRTASRAKPLEAVGARVALSLLDAIDADLVIDIVSDYEASAELVRNDDVSRALRDKTFLELASGTPKEAQRAAAWAEQNGIRYLDGAIMATPDFIGQPGCTILYSGPSAVFEEHRTILGAIAGNGLYLGSEIGHANVLDNAILVVLWGSVYGVLQGAAICEAERFSLDAFGSALEGAWPVVAPLLLSSIDRIGKRRWAADATTQSTLAPGYASVRHLLAMSKEYGIDAALPEALHRVFQRAVDAGHRDDDIAAAYQGMR